MSSNNVKEAKVVRSPDKVEFMREHLPEVKTLFTVALPTVIPSFYRRSIFVEPPTYDANLLSSVDTRDLSWFSHNMITSGLMYEGMRERLRAFDLEAPAKEEAIKIFPEVLSYRARAGIACTTSNLEILYRIEFGGNQYSQNISNVSSVCIPGGKAWIKASAENFGALLGSLVSGDNPHQTRLKSHVAGTAGDNTEVASLPIPPNFKETTTTQEGATRFGKEALPSDSDRALQMSKESKEIKRTSIADQTTELCERLKSNDSLRQIALAKGRALSDSRNPRRVVYDTSDSLLATWVTSKLRRSQVAINEDGSIRTDRYSATGERSRPFEEIKSQFLHQLRAQVESCFIQNLLDDELLPLFASTPIELKHILLGLVESRKKYANQYETKRSVTAEGKVVETRVPRYTTAAAFHFLPEFKLAKFLNQGPTELVVDSWVPLLSELLAEPSDNLSQLRTMVNKEFSARELRAPSPKESALGQDSDKAKQAVGVEFVPGPHSVARSFQVSGESYSLRLALSKDWGLQNWDQKREQLDNQVLGLALGTGNLEMLEIVNAKQSLTKPSLSEGGTSELAISLTVMAINLRNVILAGDMSARERDTNIEMLTKRNGYIQRGDELGLRKNFEQGAKTCTWIRKSSGVQMCKVAAKSSTNRTMGITVATLTGTVVSAVVLDGLILMSCTLTETRLPTGVGATHKAREQAMSLAISECEKGIDSLDIERRRS